MKTLTQRRLNQIKCLILLLILLDGVFAIRAVAAELTDMTIDFLEGEVQIVDFNESVTRFRLIGNDAVVGVRNDVHIRLVDNPYNLPKTFSIIAPMTAVEIVEGQIPSKFIHQYPLKHYFSLREEYEKKYYQSVETLISKEDTKYIFSMKKPEWEAYAKRVVHPFGWKVRLAPHDTGTSIMAYDPDTGCGLLVQPLYNNDDSTPDMLIVGSYYPPGTFPEFTDDLKSGLEVEAKEDLGSGYSVTASYTKKPQLEGIELIITKVP